MEQVSDYSNSDISNDTIEYRGCFFLLALCGGLLLIVVSMAMFLWMMIELIDAIIHYGQ